MRASSVEQWFIKVSGDQYAPIHDWFVVAETLRVHNLVYQRIETPIEWWEDAVAHAKQCKQVNTAIYQPEHDSIDIDGSMTREEACDFARILLEQGE